MKLDVSLPLDETYSALVGATTARVMELRVDPDMPSLMRASFVLSSTASSQVIVYDEVFLKALHEHLKSLGFPEAALEAKANGYFGLDFAESGMQEPGCVVLDAGKPFQEVWSSFEQACALQATTPQPSSPITPRRLGL